jgi:acetyl esterase/lipase
VRRQFGTGIGVNTVTPANYHELSEKVRVEKDIEYPSRFKSNRLDVFSPKDAAGPLATILWIHGGGFVGGDKAGIATWATMIAAKGYTVVSINYELAWENHYPGPLIQFGEAYEFLKREPQRFPFADLHRLIIGGDSAGAQICLAVCRLAEQPRICERDAAWRSRFETRPDRRPSVLRTI